METPAGEIIVCHFHERHSDLRQLRTAVFIREQQVSEAEEWDDRDKHCVHVVVQRNGQAIACGRLDHKYEGKIGRVAVLKAFRRQGYGLAVMQALEQRAHVLGLHTVHLNAQTAALPFYVQQGYISEGDTFLEAGIAHCKMKKRLA